MLTSADKPWLASYDAGVPEEVQNTSFNSLVDVLEYAFANHHNKVAFSFMGKELSFAQIDALSQQFGAYLQSLGLSKGDRVAAMMPNVPQYPVVLAAILRAGYVLVNVNPLYTARELEHQLNDSGAKAIVILENFASTLQACLQKTSIKHIVIASMGDLLGGLKGSIVNYVVRKVKKMVPTFDLPTGVRFNDALKRAQSMTLQKATLSLGDVAVLQYTGGTTGVSKGATLLHSNLVMNILQCKAWVDSAFKEVYEGNDQITTVCALPLYHIFAFTVTVWFMFMGGKTILIPNPRDLPAVLKTLSKETFHFFPAVNTLFNALANHPNFHSVNWSNLKMSLGGGMAVQSAVAKLWLEKTGCPITEAYGLSETSPLATANPASSKSFTGSIGIPVSNTSVKCIDDDGNEVAFGTPGEIAIKGPQVMAGYWQRPDETAKVMTADGYFKSGDIGIMDERGFIKIVDRKKDMILVSGFNVYPNEIEEVVVTCPGVLEAAAVGVADEKTGEAVKVVVVKKDPSLTQEQVLAHCEQNLTNYKRPKIVEFRNELPKTNVGKILRRELRS